MCVCVCVCVCVHYTVSATTHNVCRAEPAKRGISTGHMYVCVLTANVHTHSLTQYMYIDEVDVCSFL